MSKFEKILTKLVGLRSALVLVHSPAIVITLLDDIIKAMEEAVREHNAENAECDM